MTLSPIPSNLQAQALQENLLHRIVNRIRQSLELQAILQATVTEVRAFLQTDRVMVYRFHPDEHGEVIAESVNDQLPGLLGLHFPADDIPPEARELFVKARQRSIVDLSKQQICLSTPASMDETNDTSEDLRYRPVDPCHVKYLTTMGVQATVVVPILQSDRLWGLLVAHHSQPCPIAATDLHFLQLVVDQVTIAIDQSELLAQVQAQAHQESVANRIATLLHHELGNPFEVALKAIVEALDGAGGRLSLQLSSTRQPSNLYTVGTQPTLEPDILLEHHSLWRSLSAGQPEAIADLYADPRCQSLHDAFEATSIRSLLIVKLQQGTEPLGYLTLFRDEIETETLWAGKVDPDLRQTMPRESFERWRQYKSHQAQEWTTSDLNLVEAVKTHFTLAIAQYQLQTQVQALNTRLEQKIQHQSRDLANIQFALDQSSIVKITDKNGIVRYVNHKFCEISKYSRDELLGQFHPLFRSSYHSTEFWDQLWQTITQGKVWQGEIQSCTKDGIEYWVDSTIVPMLDEQGQPYQYVTIHNDITARKQAEADRQQSEIELRQQTTELQHTLAELRQTQAQLVQTEKMSSLGQLVAGVAHEINNPVNFIYGNLTHAGDYVHDLLKLLELYQQHYPSPVHPIQAEAEAIDIVFLKADLPKLLASMKVGADRIQQIVLALRTFSRMDEAEVKAVDIHAGIDSTLMILQHRLKGTAGTTAIEINRHYGKLPLVECYAGQLNQVFMNILSNAIDALEESFEFSVLSSQLQNDDISTETQHSQLKTHNLPTITISTEQIRSDTVQIRIADNGTGMNDRVRQRLFEPFFTTKPIGKGTGLGLSISYQVVVDKHGGTLTCNSAPGKGTQFIIELPLKLKKEHHHHVRV